MIAALLAALLLAAAYLAGWLTHWARTRTTVNRLDAHIEQLIADLTAISPDAAEYRQQVVADNERRRHANLARLDDLHLLRGAA